MSKALTAAGVLLFLMYCSFVAFFPIDNQEYGNLTNINAYPGFLITGIPFKALLVAFTIVRYKLILKSMYAWPMSVIYFCAIAATSSVWSIDASKSVGAVVNVILLLSYGKIIIEFFGSDKAAKITWLFGSAVVLISVVLAASGSNYGLMQGEMAGLWRGTFEHKNDFGAFCGTILLLSIFGFPLVRVSRPLLLGCVLLCVTGLIGARSATALLSVSFAVLVGLTNLVLIRIRRYRAEAISVAILLIPLVALVLFMIAPPLVEAIGRDFTFTGRTSLWEAVLPLTISNPFGAGYGTSPGDIAISLMRQQSGWLEASTTHNAYIALALDLGWLACMAYFVWLLRLVLVARYYAPSQRALPISLSALAAYQLVEGVSESNYGPYLSFNLFMIVLLLQLLRRRRAATLLSHLQQSPSLPALSQRIRSADCRSRGNPSPAGGIGEVVRAGVPPPR
jgi:O-antigen ligase